MIPIVVPPLRERVEDIPMLVEHFADKHAARCGKSIDALDDGVIASLQEYHWPGNVRELENTIERAVVLTTGSNDHARCGDDGGDGERADGRRAVVEAAPERRMDRARDDSPGARNVDASSDRPPGSWASARERCPTTWRSTHSSIRTEHEHDIREGGLPHSCRPVPDLGVVPRRPSAGRLEGPTIAAGRGRTGRGPRR